MVSIRARSNERAIPQNFIAFSPIGKVSIRARSNERAILKPLSEWDEDPNVSIRARSNERAIRGAASILALGMEFQSAPAQMSGRYL